MNEKRPYNVHFDYIPFGPGAGALCARTLHKEDDGQKPLAWHNGERWIFCRAADRAA